MTASDAKSVDAAIGALEAAMHIIEKCYCIPDPHDPQGLNRAVYDSIPGKLWMEHTPQQVSEAHEGMGGALHGLVNLRSQYEHQHIEGQPRP